MDVLNTYGGDVGAVGIAVGIFASIVGLYALLAMVYAIIKRFKTAALLFGIFVIIQIATATWQFSAETPVRHEVTLRPGYVIDATKYEIVDQRGQIYVIEERKEAHE